MLVQAMRCSESDTTVSKAFGIWDPWQISMVLLPILPTSLSPNQVSSILYGKNLQRKLRRLYSETPFMRMQDTCYGETRCSSTPWKYH